MHPREEQAGIARGDATGNPWRYPGQYEDAETGLYYNRFRYYDPESGRYVNEDPIGLAGGVAQYGYIDDPALKFDPLGLSDAAFLIKWAKELSNNPRRGRLPLSKADAQALIDLADELKVEVRASARDLGINGHSANWKLQIGIQEVKTPIPHIHIGEHHVPVEPGFEPKGGCR